MTDSSFTVRHVRWLQEKDALQAVRRAVFIDEQHVTEREEWDNLDEGCQHVLARDSQNRAIGTGRITRDGQIGRVAVLPGWRGNRVGAALMTELIHMARESGLNRCYLHAQLSALDFYTRLGFTVYGEVFMDANIPHKAMRLALKHD